jgi:hypothetical protein
MTASQYTAHCRRCLVARELSREQVMTGRNPMCESCGDAMVVYLSGGEKRVAPQAIQSK